MRWRPPRSARPRRAPPEPDRDGGRAVGPGVDDGLPATDLAVPSLVAAAPATRALSAVPGAVQGTLDAFTDQPLSIRRLIPSRVHGMVEKDSLPVFALVPLLVGVHHDPRGRWSRAASAAALLTKNIGWATDDAKTPLAPREFDRRPVGPEDVLIDIACCGVCHSDVHQARDEFGGALATVWPCMPGHEVVGTVAEVGDRVTQHAVGDRVGVGCMVFWGSEDQRGVADEQYQVPPAVFTYNGEDPVTGEVTLGGYSDQIVVHEHFVLKVPGALEMSAAAPLLCAGVTTWSPLKHWDVGPGSAVGVAGLGGLGHLAVQLAKARGADRVVVLTTTPSKREQALALGADDVIDMTDEDAAQEASASLDLVLSTIPTPFDMKPYVELVKHDGALVSVGVLEPTLPQALDFGAVSQKRVTVAGSVIGSIAETQEVLDFAAEHGISAEVQVIDVKQVNEAFDEIVAKDVRFRYVIDSATLRA